MESTFLFTNVVIKITPHMQAKLKELEFIFTELEKIQLEAKLRKVELPNVLECTPSTAGVQKDENQSVGGHGLPEGANGLCLDCRVLQSLLDESRQELLLNNRRVEELQDRIEALIKENAAYKDRTKELRMELIETKGAVRVVCRIRPSTAEAATVGLRHDERSVELMGKCFMLDSVYGEKSTQAAIYNELATLVESVMDGYKVCIFAYGQTGSGKTYTMEGPAEERGIIDRSLESIEKLSKELAKDGFQIEYTLRYLEIYNEAINDLVGGGTASIVHNAERVRIKDCKEVVMDDLSEMRGLLRDLRTKRKTGKTECNAQSSRSHLVVMLDIRMVSERETRAGTLVLVDLAGSERLADSKAENERLKETQNINRSLSMLGNVFMALRRNDKHIPFRDSKLTHLMQEYLSGQSRTALIVNIDPDSPSESICSLRFASKVAECELGKANRNITNIL